MCANRDALPYASNKPETPGFQIEIGRAIAEGLGVPLNIEWIVPRRRANVVNCDMLLDTIVDPEAQHRAEDQVRVGAAADPGAGRQRQVDAVVPPEGVEQRGQRRR